MKQQEYPFILNPSLGCPQIVALDNGKPSFFAIVAATDEHFGQWSLLPAAASQDQHLAELQLTQGAVEEITQNCATIPLSIEGTREILSKELLNNVLAQRAKIFKVALALPEVDQDKMLRNVQGKFRPALYDLCLDGTVQQRKLHAVCIIESEDSGLHFIHLTDLHLARRNDIIEQEISAAAGQIKKFNNFNDRLRQFIRCANARADKGELDFVLIGGDMVDFVNHGVDDEVNVRDNNWMCFIEIITGKGQEAQQDNTGLKVPVFTVTGNHDWRLHPYNITDMPAEFGICKQQAELFDCSYYDNKERIAAKTSEIYSNIIKQGSPILKENMLHSVLKGFLRYSETWQSKTLVPVMALLSSGINVEIKSSLLLVVIAGILHRIINALAARVVRHSITHGVISIEADVHALHYYFLHINPYFNYAFSFGSSSFIMMDTGPDCFTGQDLWDDGNKKMGRLTVRDNILGGSPDSMAFYPANEYYSYGQIVWLEKVLKASAAAQQAKRRIFICLHSPPVNTRKQPCIPAGRDEVLLEKGKINICFGTANHFLSQFFHLCLGRKENDSSYAGPEVDIVFSGHAHQKIEFRLAAGAEGPLVYHGEYSSGAAGAVFQQKRPLVVQTAACGPLNNDGYPDPPYFRQVHVDKNGTIMKFG